MQGGTSNRFKSGIDRLTFAAEREPPQESRCRTPVVDNILGWMGRQARTVVAAEVVLDAWLNRH